MVSTNMSETLRSAVGIGLTRAKLPDTPENRVGILKAMHQTLSNKGLPNPNDKPILRAIEDEILELEDE